MAVYRDDHDQDNFVVERPLDPPSSPIIDPVARDRVARLAADLDDRDDRNQDNLNTLANLMRQQISAQQETNDVQNQTNETFRGQILFQNQEIASLREDQRAQQRQINDVDNRVNVVQRGQVEDREQIAALNEGFLALRGQFNSMVEKMERAEFANDQEEGFNQENPNPDVPVNAAETGWTESDLRLPSLVLPVAVPGRGGYVEVDESFVNEKTVILGKEFSAHPFETMQTLLESFGASEVCQRFNAEFEGDSCKFVNMIYCFVNLLIQSHICTFFLPTRPAFAVLLLTTEKDTRRINKAKKRGIEFITTLQGLLDHLKPVDNEADRRRRRLQRKGWCEDCIEHDLAGESAQRLCICH